MCGICGTVRTHGHEAVDETDVRRMVDVLRHRGPDAAEVLTGREVILGHARLSIIDLARGHQPMSTADGRLRIAFNGEIYNYVELRAELQNLGHAFRTESDTEVILESYRRWGTDCVSRFNGQWAFALWDRAEKTLFLSRDPVGIRPLYYTVYRGNLLFASEIKALFQHPGVRRAFDASGLAQAFTFWSPVAPHTAFDSVYQLEPGCSLVVSTAGEALPQGPLESTRHYEHSFGRIPALRDGSIEENIERFRDAFTRAVQLRFNRSDVPVGAYLSGGIDSSVTTGAISRSTPNPLETFSLAFEDAEFDESRYQKQVSEALGTSHHSIRVAYADIGRVFPEVVRHGEQPILRTAPAPLYLLSSLVQGSGYKVVVTGEGADEMLAGYDIFREAMVRRFVARNPDSERRREILLRLYPWMERSPAHAPAFAKAFFSQSADLNDAALSHRPRWRTSSTLLRMLEPEFGAPPPGTVEDALLADLPSAFSEWKPLEQAQYLETATLLSGYILSAQGDRMLMAHSVEGRFPFLDPDVMRLAASLPPRHKLMGLDEKHILKRTYADMLPREILSRPKQPYRAPDAPAFFANGQSPEWFSELMSEKSIREAGVFNPRAVNGLLEKCRRSAGIGMSNTDNMRLVAITSTMLLHHHFVRGTGASPDASHRTPVETVTSAIEK